MHLGAGTLGIGSLLLRSSVGPRAPRGSEGTPGPEHEGLETEDSLGAFACLWSGPAAVLSTKGGAPGGTAGTQGPRDNEASKLVLLLGLAFSLSLRMLGGGKHVGWLLLVA